MRRAIAGWKTEEVGYLPFAIGDELIIVDHAESGDGWLFAERECNAAEWDDAFTGLYVNGCTIKGTLVVSGWVHERFLGHSTTYV